MQQTINNSVKNRRYPNSFKELVGNSPQKIYSKYVQGFTIYNKSAGV